MRRRGLLIVGSVVVPVLVASAVALAHDVEFHNRVTLKFAQDAFSGRVTSDKAKCTVDRTVRVVQLVDEGDNVLFAKTQTGEDATYSVPAVDPPAGDYVAKIREIDLKAGDKNAHICPKDTSNPIKVTAPPTP